MDGAVIFADDKVFESNCFENQLFDKLRADLLVFPVCCIKDLETTLKTASTFKALILDWNFESEDQDNLSGTGVVLPAKDPNMLLEDLNIYSLIYIYSQEDISEDEREALNIKFSGKIQFKKKGKLENIDEEVNSIKKDIADFENQNKHMEIPFIWSQAINQNVQTVFLELENADPNWIKEIRDTTKGDGGEPTSEVIDVFHNLLNESLIQNKSLRDALDGYNCEAQGIAGENTARLYRRIFYSKISPDAPIMTGDIFKFNDDEYGVLITPECDISKKEAYEFLVISKKGSKAIQEKQKKNYIKDPNSAGAIFNNGVMCRHILVSFPFEEDKYDSIAVIEFRSAMIVRKKTDVSGKILDLRFLFKINSPYIQQLRQRYIAFIGRYGVPAIPESLRDFNLK